MRKKMSIITTVSILVICLISSFVFATSDDGMMTRAVDGTENTIDNGGQMVGNAVQNGGAMVGNAINDGADMITDNMVDGNTPISNGIINSQTVDDIGDGAKNVVLNKKTVGWQFSENGIKDKILSEVDLSLFKDSFFDD